MNFKLLFVTLLSSATLFACDDTKPPQINIPSENINVTVSAFEGTHTINIESNTTPNAAVLDDAKLWLSVTPTKNLLPSTINLTFAQNETGKKRVGTIVVTGQSIEPQMITVTQNPRTFAQKGVLTLMEGWFGQGDSKLGFIDNDNNVTADFFGTNNNDAIIGDAATDVITYGSKAYIVVNGSDKIHVINSVTGKKLTSIDTKEYKDGQIASPRYALGLNGKVYVTTYYKGVLVLDTTELKITKNIDLTDSFHEQLVANDENIYVANSGKKGDAFGGDGRTISIIPIATEIESGTITVPANPNRLGFDKNGKLYVATWVNYVTPDENDAMLHQVDVNTKEITHTYPTPVAKFAITDNSIFTYLFSYVTYELYATEIDISNNTQSDYSEKLSEFKVQSLYDISAHNNTLYFLDQNGAIIKANADGTLIHTYESTGALNGNKVTPVYVETTTR